MVVGSGVLVKGTTVGVVMNSGIAAKVNAAAVSKLETAKSSRLSGSKSTMVAVVDPVNAIAETTQNKLKPIAPATSTPKGP